MITSKQRAALRRAANGLETVHRIGKGGITDAVCADIDEALAANELIKIRLLEASGLSAKEAAGALAHRTNANIVGCIGHVLILYRPHRDKDKRVYLL